MNIMYQFLLNLSLSILFLIGNLACAQTDNFNKYNLKFHVGTASTLHQNAPINFNQFTEGNIPEEQEAEYVPCLGLSLYRSLNPKFSLKVGLGYIRYSYTERGIGGVGDGTFSDYEFRADRDFYNINIGYRYIFNPDNMFRFFVEGSLMYEIAGEDYSSIENGLALQTMLGLIFKITDKVNISTEGLFRTALTSYTGNNLVNDYKPFAGGFQIGIHFNL